MKKIYICSPFRAKTEDGVATNQERARSYCRFVLNTMANAIPIAPHIYFPQFMDGDENEESRKLALSMCRALVGECDEVWVFGTIVTDGMAAEISTAAALRKPIYWYTKDCEVRLII